MNVPTRLLPCTALLLLTLPLHAQQPASHGPAEPAIEAQPTGGEEAVAVVTDFMARHKDLLPCQQNSSAITAYVQDHKLNPLDGSSFEKAFKELKKQGQLKLQAR